MAVKALTLLNSVERKSLDMFKLLVRLVDPYERMYSGLRDMDEWICPLSEAIRLHCEEDGDPQVLYLMLQSVTDIDLPVCVSGQVARTPLIHAISFNALETVCLLVESGGANVSLHPRWGCKRTPLQAAAQIGSVDITEYLLEQGAQVNEAVALFGGATALQLAAIGGYIPTAVVLLEQGADINASPAKFDGRTAFEGATEHGRIDMMTFLLEHGADLLSDEQKQFRRAVKFAEKNAQYGAAEHAKRLLELAQSRSVGQWTGTQERLQGI